MMVVRKIRRGTPRDGETDAIADPESPEDEYEAPAR
jgi:hypothetical protein